jgi:hypothetical protein
VLGPLAEVEEIARKHGADEIIAVNMDSGRIPQETRARLAEAGIRIRAVSDPSEIPLELEDQGGEGLCGERSILVAGNGPLVEQASALFSAASNLALVSNESGTLEAASRHAGMGGARPVCYLGIENGRVALRRALAHQRPEFVFADFALREFDIENADEAYLRTVMIPLEKLATEAVRLPEAKLVVIERSVRSVPGDAVLATELLVLDIFRRDVSRLAVVRLERDPGASRLREILTTLMNEGGGIFRANPGGDGSGNFAVTRCALADSIPGSAHLWLELTRLLDDGNAASAMRVLSEMARISPVKEHV